MVGCKQILRLRAEGVSQRGIADVLGCSRNTVAAVFAAANAAGVGFGEVADLAPPGLATCSRHTAGSAQSSGHAPTSKE